MSALSVKSLYPLADTVRGLRMTEHQADRIIGLLERVVGSGVVIDVPLSPRQQLVLEAMASMGAINSDSRQTSDEIAIRAEGKFADPSLVRASIAGLRKYGFVVTLEGRGGGCWLSAQGSARAAAIGK